MKNISVIIPVYNEEKTIGACLESLNKQSLIPLEIIVVDDGSTDKTLSEIATATKSGFAMTVKVFKQKHKGAGAARNLGVKRAKGDILVFVDGDMRFHRDFLKDLTKGLVSSLSNGFTPSLSRGTFSKLEFIGNWNNIWARFWNYRRGLFEPRAVPENFPSASPVFRAILKSEFEKAGGFNEKMGYNDDWSLSKKLDYQATETKAMFYHNNPDSLLEALKQARWESKRRYKFGIIGGLYSSWKSLFKLVKIENSWPKTFFYLIFLILINKTSTWGIIEYYLIGKTNK